jgi:DNA-directed RNA polymerase subunit alpha
MVRLSTKPRQCYRFEVAQATLAFVVTHRRNFVRRMAGLCYIHRQRKAVASEATRAQVAAARCQPLCHHGFLQGEGFPMSRIPLNQAELANQGMKDRLEMSTAEIGLAVRTTNCLEERGIFTVNDLLHCTREDLLSISNFGEKTLEEVYKSLEKIGFGRPTRAMSRSPR